MDNQIDTATGTIKLRAQFDNADEQLFPNQFVNIRLRVAAPERDGRFRPQPCSARRRHVRLRRQGQRHGDGPARRDRPGQGDRVSIATGLAPGEQVVVDGVDKLREGAKVEVVGQRFARRGARAARPARERRRAGRGYAGRVPRRP